MKTDKLLVICGPTATGKTALALQLASQLDGELVSADSRQVYRHMDIGTGKDLPPGPKKILSSIDRVFKEKTYTIAAYAIGKTRIWMYDVVNPNEQFSIAHYGYFAREAIADIQMRGKLPIVVGGTGFYIDSLIHTPESIDIPPDEALRESLGKMSTIELQTKLKEVASGVYSALNNSDKNNPRRLVRRIEIALHKKQIQKSAARPIAKDIYMIGLTTEMKTIYKKIDARIKTRLSEGIIAEIKNLLSLGYSWDLPSMTGLGYIQWKSYFEQSEKLQKKIESEIIHTWHHEECLYAKRQMTWFKKYKDIAWYNVASLGYPDNVTKDILAWYTGRCDEYQN